MSLRLIQPGATITRIYYSVPGHYTIGDEFQTWDGAVTAAQKKFTDLHASLDESLGRYATPESITSNANTQVRIDLRWVIEQPDGSSSQDVVIESYKDVMSLKTSSHLEGE